MSDHVPIRLDLGEHGASHETRVSIDGIDVSSRIRAYRLIGRAGSLARLDLEVLPHQLPAIQAELEPHQIHVTTGAAVVNLLGRWLKHEAECAHHVGAHCTCGLFSCVKDLREGRQ